MEEDIRKIRKTVMKAEFYMLDVIVDPIGTKTLKNVLNKLEELQKENVYLKAKNIKTIENVNAEVKAKIYDSFNKIFYDDCDKKEKLQAILTVEEFNKQNRYRDCGKINNAIDIVLYLAKEQLSSIVDRQCIELELLEKVNKED